MPPGSEVPGGIGEGGIYFIFALDHQDGDEPDDASGEHYLGEEFGVSCAVHARLLCCLRVSGRDRATTPDLPLPGTGDRNGNAPRPSPRGVPSSRTFLLPLLSNLQAA